jgi:hypothetical protein
MRLFSFVVSFSGTMGYIVSQAPRPEAPIVVGIEGEVPPLCSLAALRELGLSQPEVVLVTVRRESRCDPNALGAMGEIGLGQIRYEIWGRELKDAGIISRKSDLWDPQVNLRATDWVFSQLTGGTQERFRRYNGAGPKARQYAREQQRALERL